MKNTVWFGQTQVMRKVHETKRLGWDLLASLRIPVLERQSNHYDHLCTTCRTVLIFEYWKKREKERRWGVQRDLIKYSKKSLSPSKQRYTSLPAETSQNISRWISRSCSRKVPSGPLGPQHSLGSASFQPTPLRRTGCSRALTWSHLGCRDNKKKPCLQPKDPFALLGHPSAKEQRGWSEMQLLEPQEDSGRRWGRGASSPVFPLQRLHCRLRGQVLPQHPHGPSKRYSHCQRNLSPLKFPQATALAYFSNNCYLVNTFHIPLALKPTGQIQSWTASHLTAVRGPLWSRTCGRLWIGKDLI